MTPRVLAGTAARASAEIGGKARALARAEAARLPVPPWIVLTSPPTPAEPDGALDPAVAAELVAAVLRLAPDGESLAVRSSALDEDGAEHSFAGQFESYLNVYPGDVVEKVQAVRRSGFSERILAYRREHGLDPAPRPPAVLIQRMVTPRAAGVAFSSDPVSGRLAITVVSAAPGFGTAVVSGEADADTWHVDRQDVIAERRIARKDRVHVADREAPGGVRTEPLAPADAERPALTDDEVIEVARLARASARHFGRPQDIEWALSDRLYLLQSRPITTFGSRPDPDAPPVIWDNSNIVESYSGVTTPLTFSFARDIYEHVYREFCRMMAVPERLIAAEDETFKNMLGLIRGRLFYNLLNWYRLLAMLPGFGLNRPFMEGMMGVKEALPEEIAARIAGEMSRGSLRDAFNLAHSVSRLVHHLFTIERRVHAFYRRLDAALATPTPPLADRRIDELVDHYQALRGRLLLHWDAPLINDFFAMIFYGLLRRLVIRWCADPQGTLQNDLIGGEGGIVSAEPAVRMQRLAQLTRPNGALVEVLKTGTTEEVRAAIEPHCEIAREIDAYLHKFGDRTVNELKLESATLHDDPLPLFRAVGTLAAAGAPGGSRETAADRLRAETRRRVDMALARHPLRRAVFTWVAANARRRVRDRENLRLERTRLFGRVRRIFLEIGKRLHASGRLDEPRDVFYLEIGEVLAFADGRATTANLRGLVAVRKEEFAAYAAGEPPADRFETRGAVYVGQSFHAAHAPSPPAGDERKGLGCSPGIVRAQVRVVRDPTTVTPGHGWILVAEHTDPGWIMIFPSAKGVLVERGSLLSHAAIVARELGIPAVVSLPGVTNWLRDGDWVEMDGSTGTVRRLGATGTADA